MNRDNLHKLATYLEGLPTDYAHFEMREYLGIVDPNSEDFDLETDKTNCRIPPPNEPTTKYGFENGGIAQFGCGAVACAIGHGPAAGIFVTKEDLRCSFIDQGEAVHWRDYGFRVFTEDYALTDWMFGSDWGSVDNTHRGAAARIRYVLDKGGQPDSFRPHFPTVEDVEEYQEYLV